MPLLPSLQLSLGSWRPLLLSDCSFTDGPVVSPLTTAGEISQEQEKRGSSYVDAGGGVGVSVQHLHSLHVCLSGTGHKLPIRQWVREEDVQDPCSADSSPIKKQILP